MAADPEEGPTLSQKPQPRLLGWSFCKGQRAASADPEKSESSRSQMLLTPSSESYTFLIRGPTWV